MAPNDPSDADLIVRFRAGDEGAFGILCDRYAARMMGRIRLRLTPGLSRKVSPSDILQEAYVAALERFADFEDRGEGSFGHWLGRIVEHKALHAARRFRGTDKRGRVAEVSRGARADTANVVGRSPTPSQAAIGDELMDRVRRVVNELPVDDREVIRLRQEEHLTVSETAKRMGRSPDAVKVLHSRALAKLAARLGLDTTT